MRQLSTVAIFRVSRVSAQHSWYVQSESCVSSAQLKFLEWVVCQLSKVDMFRVSRLSARLSTLRGLTLNNDFSNTSHSEFSMSILSTSSWASLWPRLFIRSSIGLYTNGKRPDGSVKTFIRRLHPNRTFKNVTLSRKNKKSIMTQIAFVADGWKSFVSKVSDFGGHNVVGHKKIII